MNIFYLSKNIKKCVMYHCDKHIIKMILETTQLLCSAIWILGGKAHYKLTHKNHPCSVWTRMSKANWKWLKELGMELCKEYTYRYGKVHKTQKVIENLECPDLPNLNFSEPYQAIPDEYKNENVVVAYRNYYYNEKAHLHSWKKRDVPNWIIKRSIEKIINGDNSYK